MALRSVSMACVVVSVMAMCIYCSAVTSLVSEKYMSITGTYSLIVDKNIKIKYTEQEMAVLECQSFVLTRLL